MLALMLLERHRKNVTVMQVQYERVDQKQRMTENLGGRSATKEWKNL